MQILNLHTNIKWNFFLLKMAGQESYLYNTDRFGGKDKLLVGSQVQLIWWLPALSEVAKPISDLHTIGRKLCICFWNSLYIAYKSKVEKITLFSKYQEWVLYCTWLLNQNTEVTLRSECIYKVLTKKLWAASERHRIRQN